MDGLRICCTISAIGGRLVEQKKGADGGVDGKVFFRDHPDATAKPQVILFSVKGGNLKLDDVRALGQLGEGAGCRHRRAALHRGDHGEDEGMGGDFQL